MGGKNGKGGVHFNRRGFQCENGAERGEYEMGKRREGIMKEEEGKKRKSKDGKINKECKRLISFLEEKGWGNPERLYKEG